MKLQVGTVVCPWAALTEEGAQGPGGAPALHLPPSDLSHAHSMLSSNDGEPSGCLLLVGRNGGFWGERVFVAPNSIINITCKLSITCVPGLGHQGSSAKILPKLLKETKNNAHQTGLGSAGLCQVIHQPLYPHQLNGAGADPRED